MVSALRRAKAKENLRRAILDAARELFATEDYRAVSMRRIAEKIEYSPTAIYLHFKDKDEILLNLIGEGFTLLSSRLEALRVDDPVERLRQGAHAYFDFALTQPHYYRLMFQLEKGVVEPCDDKAALGANTFGFIRRAVVEALNQGKFDASLPEPIISHVIWAHVHGAVSLALTGHLGFMLPQAYHTAFFEEVVETTLRGLQATA